MYSVDTITSNQAAEVDTSLRYVTVHYIIGEGTGEECASNLRTKMTIFIAAGSSLKSPVGPLERQGDGETETLMPDASISITTTESAAGDCWPS